MKSLACIALLLSLNAYAGTIHKWVDDKGNVHYGDAPPVSTQTKQLRVDGVPSKLGKTLPRLNDQEGGDASNSVNQQSSEEQAQLACEQARKDLEVISNNSQIKLKQSDGTEKFMTDEEIQQRKEIAEKDIENFANKFHLKNHLLFISGDQITRYRK